MTNTRWRESLVAGSVTSLAFVVVVVSSLLLANNVFDDSFISYRYAWNLAQGHGLVWNAGGEPTEGFTNLLLVLLLAPAIKLGADPLVVTRCLSFMALCAIAWLVFRTGKRVLGVSREIAAVGAAIVLTVPASAGLVMLGLETVVYSLAILAAIATAANYLSSPTQGKATAFGLITFAAYLLRPEGVLLYLAVAAIALMASGGAVHVRVFSNKWLLIFPVLVALHVAWRLFYFGYLFPNPFHVKAPEQGIISPTGATSIAKFAVENSFVWVVAWICLFGFALMWKRGTRQLDQEFFFYFVVGTYAVLHSALILRTNTLMDAEQRFMYPLLAPLAICALPAIRRIGDIVLAQTQSILPHLGVCLALVFVAVAPSTDFLQNVTGGAVKMLSSRALIDQGDSTSLMQVEKRLASQLSEYPSVAETKIAFGDAGVMAYATKAPWLDVVGLNDNFIARERNLDALTDYVFEQNPDLVIMVSDDHQNWIDYGHGPLGDYPSWSDDRRWDAYEYVGTTATSAYDLFFLVRRESQRFDSLKGFLRQRVVDGWYEELPIRLGSQPGFPLEESQWVSRESGLEGARPIPN